MVSEQYSNSVSNLHTDNSPGSPLRCLVSIPLKNGRAALNQLVADYGFASTRPAQGETLKAGSFARWYLDLFLDGAIKVCRKKERESSVQYLCPLAGQGARFVLVACQNASRSANRHVLSEDTVEIIQHQREEHICGKAIIQTLSWIQGLYM